MRVQVTAIRKPGDQSVFALCKGGRSNVSKPDGGFGLGRHFPPDEPEPTPGRG